MLRSAALDPSVDLEGYPLVGVASTRYNDPEGLDAVRYGVALKTVQAFRASETPLIIVDNSELAEIGDSFAERGALVVQAKQGGLATQYMEGVAHAVEHGADRVLRQEPEKTGLINFRADIVAALETNDIVVIGRTEKGMQSLPTIQAATERVAGRLLEDILGMPADALSGGRAYTRRGAEYLAKYDLARHGNTWLHLYHPVLEAKADGVPVGGVQLDLIHPAEMVAEEEGNPMFAKKRISQFEMQLANLLPTASYRFGEFSWQR